MVLIYFNVFFLRYMKSVSNCYLSELNMKFLCVFIYLFKSPCLYTVSRRLVLLFLPPSIHPLFFPSSCLQLSAHCVISRLCHLQPTRLSVINTTKVWTFSAQLPSVFLLLRTPSVNHSCSRQKGAVNGLVRQEWSWRSLPLIGPLRLRSFALCKSLAGNRWHL